MFDELNVKATRVVREANYTRRQHLASLIYSYVPVRSEQDFWALHAQVGVLRTLLKLRPSYSKRLVETVNDLIRESTVVADSLRTV